MDKKYNILVVEDEISINDILTSALRNEGYSVRSAFNGSEARMFFNNFNPDLILLDVNLPDESGFDICKFFSSIRYVPILFLTARTDIIDKILGLELGADDYITKPFHIKEILTRVKIALRRIDKINNFSKSKSDIAYLNNAIKINYSSHTVYKNESEVKLKPKEYELLEYFSNNPNQVLSREMILEKVWGLDYEGDERTVDVHVRKLRSKLDIEGNPSLIETIFSVGYIMRLNNENKE